MWALQSTAILADIWFSRSRHGREEPKSWLKWKSQNSVIHEFSSTQTFNYNTHVNIPCVSFGDGFRGYIIIFLAWQDRLNIGEAYEMHGCCNCLPLDLIVDPQQKYIIYGRIRAFFFVHCFESIQIVPGVLSGSIIMILMVLRVRRNRPRSTITRHSFLKNGSSTCKL